MQSVDLTGQTFSFLTVEEPIYRPHRRTWNCRCVCGVLHEVTTGNLRNGSIRSCGCRRKDELARSMTKHGANRGGRRTKEYRAWSHIIGRCRNPGDGGWEHYGARGVCVSEEWAQSFEAFFAHVGAAPSPQHSIDRIDNNGHYEPGNVRWATSAQQSRNTRRTIRIGDLCLRDACLVAGVSYGAVQARIRRGQQPDEAIRCLKK